VVCEVVADDVMVVVAELVTVEAARMHTESDPSPPYTSTSPPYKCK
jgi:hypothetical protein